MSWPKRISLTVAMLLPDQAQLLFWQMYPQATPDQVNAFAILNARASVFGDQPNYSLWSKKYAGKSDCLRD